MTCQRYDIDVQQGATWFQQLAYQVDGEALDILDYEARMMVRKSYNLPAAITLTTENGRIIASNVNNIDLEIDAVAAWVVGQIKG